GDKDYFHIEGFMESPAVDDDGDCFSPLLLNATSINVEVYYNKAVNYTLMVTFVSFLQVLLLIRQMEHSNTQSGAAKVSIVMIGQQAIMDSYLCLLHLTAGILVESLFNAFATAAFFKFVVFSIFEMRYLLAIWKATRPSNSGGDKDYFHIEGFMESPAVDDDGDCFSPLLLNATSINVEVYYNKAVNYTLMVTFVSFLQVLLLIRQMEHSNTQSGAAKVSIVMIGQQAIMDSYLCLLHLTAGILVESLFNAFATAAFFKFVVFSIFEMRYLLAIWKATRPSNSGEGWETMRRELSFLYSRFYGILLGGVLIMYELHNYMRWILLVMYSFWIPQIVANVVRDSRKPLHPYYILGMTVTRLAIPLYVFGCPKNFMRVEASKAWCIGLCAFIGFQAAVLLLQHYFGSRCFVPRKMLPEKYNYYRRLDHDVNRSRDCVICMATIDLRRRTNDCMVTPCEHLFHSGCLQRWMDIKMECPTCRRTLPPA
ncbi:hypothetical protein DY000_02020072, partial [Brassica cretica]